MTHLSAPQARYRLRRLLYFFGLSLFILNAWRRLPIVGPWLATAFDWTLVPTPWFTVTVLETLSVLYAIIILYAFFWRRIG